MQYVIFKENNKKRFVAETIVTVPRQGQKVAINLIKKHYKGKGKFWIFPLSHSAFFEFDKKGKVIKERFYKNL